jgi:hypothetical protein
MYWSKSKQFTIFLWVVAVLILPVVEANQDIRKNRYGHNCVVVETGEVSPYYTCRGWYVVTVSYTVLLYWIIIQT